MTSPDLSSFPAFFTGALPALLTREGGFVDHPADRGGATCHGLSEAVARRHGWTGAMADLPLSFAAEVYYQDYWQPLQLEAVAQQSVTLATTLFDTAVLCGPRRAGVWLQRVLTAANEGQKLYPDVAPDGVIGEQTLSALATLCHRRGEATGDLLAMAVQALRCAAALKLSEQDPSQKAFFWGWLRRIGDLAKGSLPKGDRPKGDLH